MVLGANGANQPLHQHPAGRQKVNEPHMYATVVDFSMGWSSPKSQVLIDMK